MLIAFLGYMTAVTGLVLDIGKPWNIWRPLFYWNVHSPLFEVAWCIILYSLVMLAEFAPVVGERLRWEGFTRVFARLTPGAGGAGRGHLHPAPVHPGHPLHPERQPPPPALVLARC